MLLFPVYVCDNDASQYKCNAADGDTTTPDSGWCSGTTECTDGSDEFGCPAPCNHVLTALTDPGNSALPYTQKRVGDPNVTMSEDRTIGTTDHLE